MPYVMSRRSKPTLYQRDDGMYGCEGRGHTAVGNSARGAYTRWKNAVALAELSADGVNQLRASAASIRNPIFFGGMI